jgi:catechol 2,3-dioxygenase-like lactoylglutathione lyase family enzyme
VIGMVGFINALVPGMGYILHRDVWRQGYGSEAVRAAVSYGFEQLALSRVELWIHHGNRASRRLAESVGFQQRGQFVQAFPHLGQYETLVYGLRAAEWTHGTQRWETAFRGVYPVIATRDVAGSVAFYRDMLGFHVSYFDTQSPDYAIVARGEWTSERAELHFVREADAALKGRLRLPVGPHITRLLNEFQQHGVPIAVPLNAKPWGQEFEIVDNNGWTLVFMG